MKKEEIILLTKLLNNFMVEYNERFFGYDDLGQVKYTEILEAIIKINKEKMSNNKEK